MSTRNILTNFQIFFLIPNAHITHEKIKYRNKRICIETPRIFKNISLLSDEDQGGCKRFLNRVLEKSMANVKFDLCGAPGADPRL